MGGGSSTRHRESAYTITCTSNNQSAAAIDWLGRALKVKGALSLNVFRIETIVGTGFVGSVATAQHKASKKYFALKSVYKSDAVAKKMVTSLFREKQALRDLGGIPGVVQSFGTLQTRDQVIFVLEYVPGGELFHWLHEYRAFSDMEAKFYAAELLVCLERIHAEDYVYRDLKPENVLLDASGHLKLVDFGFSKPHMTLETRTYTSLGTPQYLAPEQLKPQGGYTRAVDWWALGCVVFELLVGRTPFYKGRGDSPFEIYTRVVQGSFSCPKTISKDAKDFISQLLRPERSRRLVDPSIMRAHPWFTSIVWADVEAHQILPPIIPSLHRPGDVTCFDAPSVPARDPRSVQCTAAMDDAFVEF
ncbi:AGC/PKA protein kinase [Saprolegnia parasitica CBS 223.65]|uniref:non-specific serine/threonine protein kinase n=1 Tax=Saprolegnia parasitica (strain CBS 223.65) TaxID=695850 RepID=A0A067CEY1_SAPPC|nr:AGC/PKA protein kinase [Saprolegnia parasitica CBS 223.65]KDO29063.1 AGC/PKA protein kinase [Saprolegnia parasitica CBS 223.65]|eukprot:XP_012200233.1 AGC/PKA protein kinase [Saprolegnia parasitica CBS 223.65]